LLDNRRGASMRHFSLLVAIAFCIGGCDLGERIPTPSESLQPTFRMTDTTGRETNSFRFGEEFDVSFTVINTTGKTLTFYRGDSGPDVVFRILKADTLIASSIDGYVFLMVVTVGHLPSGETLQGLWRGPNTPARTPRLVLPPGIYTVQAFYPQFDEVGVKKVSPMIFSVLP